MSWRVKKQVDNLLRMKERITITMDKELLNWLDEKIKEKVFANRSHGFEFLIKNRMDEELKKKDE